MPGQRCRKILGCDDRIDVLQEIDDARTRFLDVQNGRYAGVSRHACGVSRSCRIDAVEHQHASRDHGLVRYVHRIDGQSRVPIPEHRSFAGPGVDEDHRKLVGRARHGAGRRGIDASPGEALASLGPELVVAKAPDVARFPAKARAGGQRRGNLASRMASEALQPLFCVAGGVIGDDGHQIDAVLSQTHDIERSDGHARHSKRDPHRSGIVPQPLYSRCTASPSPHCCRLISERPSPSVI